MELDTVVCGDCLEVMAGMEDRCIQCCVTSPPYWGLRDYGVNGQIGLEKTPEEYVAKLVAVFREVRRVLRDDGTLWLVLGDSYAGGGRGGGEKGYAGKKQITNKGSVYLKSSTIPDNLKSKDLVGIPWRVAFALQADSWWLRSDIIWHKPNPMPESVTDRPTKAHEYIFLLAKSEQYFYDAVAIREENSPTSGKWGKSVVSKTAQAQGNGRHGKTGFLGGELDHDEVTARYYTNGRNRRSVWTVATQPFAGAHFATFPEKLVEPCILAGSRKSDVVLDPFIGSGTTAVAALKLGRHFHGCDISQEYVDIANERIAKARLEMSQMELAL